MATKSPRAESRSASPRLSLLCTLRDGIRVYVAKDGRFRIGPAPKGRPNHATTYQEWMARRPGDRRAIRRALWDRGFRGTAHATVH